MAYKLKSLNSCPQHPLTFHVSLGRWHSALWEETTLSAERHTFSNHLPFWPWLWRVWILSKLSSKAPLLWAQLGLSHPALHQSLKRDWSYSGGGICELWVVLWSPCSWAAWAFRNSHAFSSQKVLCHGGLSKTPSQALTLQPYSNRNHIRLTVSITT